MRQVLKRIAKFFEPLIQAWIYPIAWLSGRSVNMEKALLWPTIKSFSKHSKDHVIQYTSLPRNVDSIPCEWRNEKSLRFSDYAIILQGPVSEGEFTIDTLNLYKKYYPGVTLIVSTWIGLKESQREKIRKTGAVLIESEPPQPQGPGHINLQLASSYAGAKKAYELGCSYALKARTDQRLYANDALLYLHNLQKAFPSGNPDIVKNRLVYISYGKSYRYLPFALCDFVVFGETIELMKLYGIKRDPRPSNWHQEYEKEIKAFCRKFFDELETQSQGSPYELLDDFEEQYFRYMLGEVHIVYQYYCANIHTLVSGEDLQKAYLSYLKHYAVIADSEKLLLYWPKYNEYIVKNETELDFLSKLDFKKWLDIYLNEDK